MGAKPPNSSKALAIDQKTIYNSAILREEVEVRRAAIGLTVFVMLLLTACGGGASAPSTPAAGKTVAPKSLTSTPNVAATNAQVIEVIAIDYELNPREFTLKKDKPYIFKLTNNGEKPHTLTANRWRVDIFALAGASAQSEVFSESVTGEYNCFDRLWAARYELMKCIVKVTD
mgnify:CR=1 FL=1